MVFLPIPNLPRYCISENGTVLDVVEERIVRHKDDLLSDSRIKLLLKNRTSRFRSISIARLVLITHKPLEGVTLDSLWAPKIINPLLDRVNVHNLEYDFGDYSPPTVVDENEFYSVPGELPGLMVNLKGQVRLRGGLLETKIVKGYRVVSLTNRNGTTRYIGIYRLLAITFLQRPIDYSEIIVNHKDGNPLNDDLSNLEWATYYSNIVHAHETGLMKNHKPVEVRSTKTGEVSVFFSIGAFSRFLNLNQRETKRLEFRMRMFKAIKDYRGYKVRFKEDAPEWDEIGKLDKYQGNTKEVVVENRLTGETREFLWFKDSADFLGVSQHRLREALRKQTSITVGDYSVSYLLPHISAGNTVI